MHRLLKSLFGLGRNIAISGSDHQVGQLGIVAAMGFGALDVDHPLLGGPGGRVVAKDGLIAGQQFMAAQIIRQLLHLGPQFGHQLQIFFVCLLLDRRGQGGLDLGLGPPVLHLLLGRFETRFKRHVRVAGRADAQIKRRTATADNEQCQNHGDNGRRPGLALTRCAFPDLRVRCQNTAGNFGACALRVRLGDHAALQVAFHLFQLIAVHLKVVSRRVFRRVFSPHQREGQKRNNDTRQRNCDDPEQHKRLLCHSPLM